MRKLTRNQYKNLVTLVSSFENMEMFLEYAFVTLPGVADGSKFTSDYSLYLGYRLYAAMEKIVLARWSQQWLVSHVWLAPVTALILYS